MDRRQVLLWMFVLCETWGATFGSLLCEEDKDCGWNAQCVNNNQCSCYQGFMLSSNNKDCVDTYCTDPKCLDCTSDKDKCRHCIGFIEEDTGVCLDSCESDYKFYVEGSQIGRVCPAKTEIWSSIYVAVIVGVIAGVLLICVVTLACYWKLKSDKERKLRFDLLNKQLVMEHKPLKNASQSYISYIDDPYDQVSDSLSVSGRGTHLNMIQNMAALRREWDLVIQMYTEARSKVQRLNKESPMWRKYKNIGHGLGKVIALLRQKDPDLGPECPALFEWAVALLCDYRQVMQERELSQSIEARSVTPGSSLTRLTSAFQQDHFLSNGHIPGDVSPSTTTMSFTYERVPGQCTTFQGDREVGEISFIALRDDYTDPVDV